MQAAANFTSSGLRNAVNGCQISLDVLRHQIEARRED